VLAQHPLAALVLHNLTGKLSHPIKSLPAIRGGSTLDGGFSYKASVDANPSRAVLSFVFERGEGDKGPELAPVRVEVSRNGQVAIALLDPAVARALEKNVTATCDAAAKEQTATTSQQQQ
jgi:hypothetical protein